MTPNWGGQKVRRNIRPLLQTGTDSWVEDGRSITPIPHKRTEADRFGERFRRYFNPEQETKLGGGLQAPTWDVAPPQLFFDELFRVSKDQIIWGGNYF